MQPDPGPPYVCPFDLTELELELLLDERCGIVRHR